ACRRRGGLVRGRASALVILASLSLAACSGPNFHKDLTDTPDVLVRRSTLPTRTLPAQAKRQVDFSNPILWQNTLIFGDQTNGLTSLYPGLLLKRWLLPITGGVVSPLTEDHGSVFFGGADGF